MYKPVTTSHPKSFLWIFNFHKKENNNKNETFPKSDAKHIIIVIHCIEITERLLFNFFFIFINYGFRNRLRFVIMASVGEKLS